MELKEPAAALCPRPTALHIADTPPGTTHACNTCKFISLAFAIALVRVQPTLRCTACGVLFVGSRFAPGLLKSASERKTSYLLLCISVFMGELMHGLVTARFARATVKAAASRELGQISIDMASEHLSIFQSSSNENVASAGAYESSSACALHGALGRDTSLRRRSPSSR